MTIRKIGEPARDESTILRVTIPKSLLKEIRATKKMCKENGFVFDIKPDVRQAIERAIAEAKQAVKEAVEKDKKSGQA